MLGPKQLTEQQRADVERLMKPRPFEPDPRKHAQLIREAQAASRRLRRAGIDPFDTYLDLKEEA